jgi:hypothetical protein
MEENHKNLQPQYPVSMPKFECEIPEQKTEMLPTHHHYLTEIY